MEKIQKLLSIIPTKHCKCLANLNEKTVLITGGNSGIGYETARILASRGAKVIIGDIQTTYTAKCKIIQTTDNNDVHLKYLDLGCLDSIRAFAQHINETESRLDILINNAGVGGLKHAYTEDLLQKEMQINHFGPFLLTHLLLDLLKRSEPSRIIFVSSLLAYFNNLTLENLNTVSPFPISDFLVYSNSKLCNIITANIFADRLRNTNITVNSLHPGFTVTDLYRGMRGENSLLILKKLIYFLLNFVAKDSYQGAQTSVHLALSKNLKKTSGKFFIECKQFDPPFKATDRDFCERIWEASEEYVRLQDFEKLVNQPLLGVLH